MGDNYLGMIFAVLPMKELSSITGSLFEVLLFYVCICIKRILSHTIEFFSPGKTRMHPINLAKQIEKLVYESMDT